MRSHGFRPMLRVLVLLLLLANAGYFAWSQGLLAAWGFAPEATGEPQRLRQQIKPEALRLLQGNELRRLEVAPPSETKGPVS